MASLAQFAFNTVRDGVSARAGLAAMRAAGLKVRDATWFRAVGEARAHYGNRVTELAQAQNVRPRRDQVPKISTRAQRGFRQYVDIWIKEKGIDQPRVVSQAVITDRLLSRQAAVDKAVEGYRRAQARRQATGATAITLPDAAIVGAIYTATLEFVPESEFAPEPQPSRGAVQTGGIPLAFVAPNWRTEVERFMVVNRLGQLIPSDEGERAWPRPRLVSDTVTQSRIEATLRAVIGQLTGGTPREFVRLPAIRDALARLDLDRAMQDAAILGLTAQADARVIKIANLKSLTNDDFRAAVHIGGEFKHAVGIGF